MELFLGFVTLVAVGVSLFLVIREKERPINSNATWRYQIKSAVSETQEKKRFEQENRQRQQYFSQFTQLQIERGDASNPPLPPAPKPNLVGEEIGLWMKVSDVQPDGKVSLYCENHRHPGRQYFPNPYDYRPWRTSIDAPILLASRLRKEESVWLFGDHPLGCLRATHADHAGECGR